MKDTHPPVIVEQTFNASAETVWDAITSLEQMKQWFFENIESFRPEVGFKTRFNVQVEDRNFLHLWELTEVAPGKKITYSWKYAGYPGDSFVIFGLSGGNGTTVLRVTHTGIENFPRDVPEFTRESCAGGWNYFIKERLVSFLEKNNG